MKKQLTDEKKKEMLEYLDQNNFLKNFLYDIDLMPEQISDEPLMLHYMFGMISMYRILDTLQRK